MMGSYEQGSRDAPAQNNKGHAPQVHAPSLGAFSGKVDTGFPSENATTQKEVERFPIQSNRKAL
jgi:hypothetical protein